MAQPSRLGMTEVQKSELWRRWRKGESIHEISRALGRRRFTIRSTLKRQGGFTPPVRKRSPDALSLAEREEISRGLSAGQSMRQIAIALQRSPSPISREIARNDRPHHINRGGLRGSASQYADSDTSRIKCRRDGLKTTDALKHAREARKCCTNTGVTAFSL